ncbi:MAG: hypothetical protein PUE08_06845 [Eubacteriales bacterium]|nr:hypothetical protein [Eubacteriales bacterium]
MADILKKLAEENEKQENEVQIVNEGINDGGLTSFRFDNKLYYYAVRDDVLIFDHHKRLFYTMSIDDLRESDHPFFQKVYSLVCDIAQDSFKLFVKRHGSYDSISFTSKFDATFIFKKLKKIASREIEEIEEILVEKNGVLIDSFRPNEKKQRFYVNFKDLKNRVVNRKGNSINIETSPQINTLVKVEDTIDSLIGASLVEENVNINPEKLDKCIALLESLKK